MLVGVKNKVVTLLTLFTLQQNLTAQGLIQREDPPKRPFVLTRAFYAGSQRFGAMWTGDNLGTWEHLASTVPMLLTNGISGMTFSGGKSELRSMRCIHL